MVLLRQLTFLLLCNVLVYFFLFCDAAYATHTHSAVCAKARRLSVRRSQCSIENG